MIQEFYQQGRFSKHCQCFLQSFAGFFLLLLKCNFLSFLHANLPANTCIKQSVTGKAIMLYFMTPWAQKTEIGCRLTYELRNGKLDRAKQNSAVVYHNFTLFLLRNFQQIVFPAKHKQIELLFLFFILWSKAFFCSLISATFSKNLAKVSMKIRYGSIRSWSLVHLLII